LNIESKTEREKHMEISNQIASILEEYYDITEPHIEQRVGGWSASAFFIEEKRKKYFLKVYSKKKPSVLQWICAIDRYTPLVQWLHDNTVLKNNIPNLIFTNLKSNKCEDEEFVYLLSEYIEGTTIGGDPLSYNQINELSKILGILHASTLNIPNELKEKQLKEDFQIGFCECLSSFICKDLHIKNDTLLHIVKPYTNCLLENIDRMRVLSDSLKNNSQQFVLCHSDAHNWNIIQGENMTIIDWECLKLAPQEQDLILNVTEPYAMQFIYEYKKYMDYDEPNLDAFEFYFLKRRLEDIWEWIKDLRLEGLVKSEETTYELLKLSLEDCTRIEIFRSDIKKIFY
jgi:spectinomycin phosphotransferase